MERPTFLRSECGDFDWGELHDQMVLIFSEPDNPNDHATIC
jgi:hypothetical protein